MKLGKKHKEYDFSGSSLQEAKATVQASAEYAAELEKSISEQRKLVRLIHNWVNTIEALKTELRSIRQMPEADRVRKASKFMASNNPIIPKINAMMQTAQSFANYNIPKSMMKELQSKILAFNDQFIHGAGLFEYSAGPGFSKHKKDARSITVLRDQLVEMRDALQTSIKTTTENLHEMEKQLEAGFEQFVAMNKKKGVDPLVQMHQVKEKMLDNSRWLRFIKGVAKTFRLTKSFDKWLNKKAMIVVNKAAGQATMEKVHVPGVVKLNNVYQNEKLTTAAEKAPSQVKEKVADNPSITDKHKKKATAHPVKKGAAKRLAKLGAIFKGKRQRAQHVEVATAVPTPTKGN